MLRRIRYEHLFFCLLLISCTKSQVAWEDGKAVEPSDSANTSVSGDDVLESVALDYPLLTVGHGFSAAIRPLTLLQGTVNYSASGSITMAPSLGDNTFLATGRSNGTLTVSNAGILDSSAKITVPASGIDTTFGTEGRVFTDLVMPTTAAIFVQGTPIAALKDGRLLVAGAFPVAIDETNNNYEFAVARYLANGHLDSSFGTNGIVIFQLSTNEDVATSILIEPSGKIVVAGYEKGNGNFGDPQITVVVARLNENGSSDLSFGNQGFFRHDFGYAETGVSGYSSVANSMARQADGKLVFGGHVQFGPEGPGGLNRNVDNLIFRLTSAGQLDPSFNNGKGYVVDRFYGGPSTIGSTSDKPSEITSLILDGSENIVVAGYIEGCAPHTRESFAIARYNTDGVLDPSFGVGGKNCIKLSGTKSNQDDRALTMTLLADQSFLLAGLYDYSNSRGGIIRLDSNGLRDIQFAESGLLVTGPEGTLADGMIVQPSGELMVFGSPPLFGSTVYFERFSANLEPIESFGSQGTLLDTFQINTNEGSSKLKGYAIQNTSTFRGRVVFARTHGLFSPDKMELLAIWP